MGTNYTSSTALGRADGTESSEKTKVIIYIVGCVHPTSVQFNLITSSFYHANIDKRTNLSHRGRERARNAVLPPVSRRLDANADGGVALLNRPKLHVGGVIFDRRRRVRQGASSSGEERNGRLHRWDGVFDGGSHRPTFRGVPRAENREQREKGGENVHTKQVHTDTMRYTEPQTKKLRAVPRSRARMEASPPVRLSVEERVEQAVREAVRRALANQRRTQEEELDALSDVLQRLD